MGKQLEWEYMIVFAHFDLIICVLSGCRCSVGKLIKTLSSKEQLVILERNSSKCCITGENHRSLKSEQREKIVQNRNWGH